MSDQRTVNIEDHSGLAIEEKDRIILRYLTEAGLHLMGQSAKELEDDPRRIDTGLLRNSITFALGGERPAMSSYRSNATDKHGDSVEPVGSGTYDGTVPEDHGSARSVYVGTNVEYAMYVHEGTVDMAPNRFIKNAFLNNEKQLIDKLKEALKG